ncbi:MAG: DUF3291 domain-containing protein [Actinomycetota bacterium]
MHVAQVNVARMVAPLDDPQLAGFVARLEDINALADGAPGFMWRLQTAEGDATSLRPYDDDRIIFNLSVWRSVDDLKDFVYGTAHHDVMRRRAEWFARATDAYYALWWVDEGAIPSVDEAKDRLERLRRDGPSPEVFTFRRIYEPA